MMGPMGPMGPPMMQGPSMGMRPPMEGPMRPPMGMRGMNLNLDIDINQRPQTPVVTPGYVQGNSQCFHSLNVFLTRLQRTVSVNVLEYIL